MCYRYSPIRKVGRLLFLYDYMAILRSATPHRWRFMAVASWPLRMWAA